MEISLSNKWQPSKTPKLSDWTEVLTLNMNCESELGTWIASIISENENYFHYHWGVNLATVGCVSMFHGDSKHETRVVFILRHYTRLTEKEWNTLHEHSKEKGKYWTVSTPRWEKKLTIAMTQENGAHHCNDVENETHKATWQNESESNQGAGFAHSAKWKRAIFKSLTCGVP